MKKILSAVVAAGLALGLSISAFALDGGGIVKPRAGSEVALTIRSGDTKVAGIHFYADNDPDQFYFNVNTDMDDCKFKDLFADQEAVKVAVLSGILCFFAQQEQALLSDAVEEDFGLDCLPHILEAEDLMGEIWLEEVHILPVERDGLCYIGYAFRCRWDEEGLGVMTCGRRVVETGGRDTSLLCWLAEDDLEHPH